MLGENLQCWHWWFCMRPVAGLGATIITDFCNNNHNNHNNNPHPNLAASHTGTGPSCVLSSSFFSPPPKLFWILLYLNGKLFFSVLTSHQQVVYLRELSLCINVLQVDNGERQCFEEEVQICSFVELFKYKFFLNWCLWEYLNSNLNWYLGYGKM